MQYRVIGLMSGSSLDGLDIAFTELTESNGDWSFEIIAAECLPYDEAWRTRLQNATALNALDYQLLHADYGHYLGLAVNRFIEQHGLQFRVGLIASHGHTTFHLPAQGMTAQLGEGAAIAAETGLPVISDLRSLDLAFGGQGAPIVPMGEKLLFKAYPLLLNIGGIANLSVRKPEGYTAFDVCPANRVLNLLAGAVGKEYDEGGKMAAMGNVNDALLEALNALAYYRQSPPKSLANSFGTEEVWPLIRSFGLTHNDGLRTCVEHVVRQIRLAIEKADTRFDGASLLVTGGGAFNSFLIERLQATLLPLGIAVVVPDESVVMYKEALVMALLGVLRWRQEYTVMASVTGARRDSIGGAVWIGQEA